MLNEREIVERIIELEARNDVENDAYLDEGEQSRLSTLYEVLDRELTKSEMKYVDKMREARFGEYDDNEYDGDTSHNYYW